MNPNDGNNQPGVPTDPTTVVTNPQTNIPEVPGAGEAVTPSPIINPASPQDTPLETNTGGAAVGGLGSVGDPGMASPVAPNDPNVTTPVDTTNNTGSSDPNSGQVS